MEANIRFTQALLVYLKTREVARRHVGYFSTFGSDFGRTPAIPGPGLHDEKFMEAAKISKAKQSSKLLQKFSLFSTKQKQ